MDKQQKLKIALPILAVIIAVVWGPIIFGGGSKHKGARKADNLNTAVASSGGAADLIVLARSNERKKARTSYEDWGRNPFTLSEAPRSSVLEGIMWDAQNPKAIINGNILGIGDFVGTGTIIEIQPDAVIIRNGAIEKKYRLGQ